MKRLALALLILGASALPARANSVSISTNTSTTPIINDNTNRKGLFIQNDSTQTVYIDWVNRSTTTMISSGWILYSSATVSTSQLSASYYSGPVYGFTANPPVTIRYLETLK
jgi:hypothetical protein